MKAITYYSKCYSDAEAITRSKTMETIKSFIGRLAGDDKSK